MNIFTRINNEIMDGEGVIIFIDSYPLHNVIEKVFGENNFQRHKLLHL